MAFTCAHGVSGRVESWLFKKLKDGDSIYWVPHLVLFGLWTGRLWPGPLCRPTISVPCSELQLSLEEPVETAILLSLVGVGSIVASQWPTVLQDNAMRARVLWESEWFRHCHPVLRPRGLLGPAGGGWPISELVLL